MAYQKLTPIIATGSTAPRYLGDRFSDIVNLRDFGAVGDGETDDSAAWAAWQTAYQNGAYAYIPAGDYKLGASGVHVPGGHFRYKTNFSYNDGWDVLEHIAKTIYVSSDGDNLNDGMSEDACVSSFAKAISIGNSLGLSCFNVFVAAGTYTEDVELENVSCKIQIDGDVVLSGSLQVAASKIEITQKQTGKSFTISGYTEIRDSDVTINSVYNSTASEIVNLFYINNSNVVFTEEVNINSVSSSVNPSCFNLENNACVVFNDEIAITGSGIAHGFWVNYNSYVSLEAGVTIAAVNGNGIVAAYNSYATIKEKFTLQSGGGWALVRTSEGGGIFFDEANINITKTAGGGHLFCAQNASYVTIYLPSGKTAQISNTSANNTCFDAESLGLILMSGSGSIQINGSFSWATVAAQYKGYVLTDSALQFSGSVTGKRYDVHSYSIIDSKGGGANKYPGSIAGNASSTGIYC